MLTSLIIPSTPHLTHGMQPDFITPSSCSVRIPFDCLIQKIKSVSFFIFIGSGDQDSPSRTTVPTRGSAKAARAAALVVEISAVACDAAVAGAAAAVDGGDVGGDARVGEALLAVVVQRPC